METFRSLQITNIASRPREKYTKHTHLYNRLAMPPFLLILQLEPKRLHDSGGNAIFEWRADSKLLCVEVCYKRYRPPLRNVTWTSWLRFFFGVGGGGPSGSGGNTISEVGTVHCEAVEVAILEVSGSIGGSVD
jgi:hypothetical protein